MREEVLLRLLYQDTSFHKEHPARLPVSKDINTLVIVVFVLVLQGFVILSITCLGYISLLSSPVAIDF